MKSLFRYFSIALCAFSAQMAHAIIEPCPGSFAISGEYLYFHPIYNQSYFVVKGDRSIETIGLNGTRVDNPMNYQSGYRLEGIYAFCNSCTDIDLRFTYLNSNNNTRNITSPFLSIGTNGESQIRDYAGIANSTIDLKYYAADALLGQKVYNCCCFDLKLQGGLHYANIQFNEDLLYAGDASSGLVFRIADRARAQFWGIGPEIAMAMEYIFPSCLTGGYFPLSLVGNARGALLAGQSDTSYRSVVTGIPSVTNLNYDFNNDNKWLVVPMWDIRFGLSTEHCFSCFSANLEVGFEILRYEGVIQTQNPIVADAVITDDYSNLGFYGPYVALGFSF